MADWGEIEAVLDVVLSHPEEVWERVTLEECGGDEDLAREVRSVLRDSAASEAYLSDLGRRVGLPLPRSSSEDLVGRTVGRYRLVRLLGRGGMGAVYLGEHDEGDFTVRAAVKVVAAGVLSPRARERFRAERRVLSGLHHPNIASLIDGGVTEDGTPYFVMEYVEGQPIDVYCDERRLGLKGRIDRVLKVCAALQHAHERLVIHRDLKPDNILVGSAGEVRLLDFGIAHALEAAGDGFRTATRQPHPMTLAYASPEQIRGEALSAATDVYGLGVLLYRLLTGRHPYRVSSTSFAEAERAICELDPLPPDRALDRALATGEGDAEPPSAEELARQRSTTVARLRKELRGDLGRILLVALRKEPERRYGSVAELADDLTRYLRGFPVYAQPDTRAYRVRHFVARHRVTTAVAAAIALLTVSLAFVGVRYVLDTRAQSARIAEEAAVNEEVFTFLLDVLAMADPADGLGDTLTVRAALERGVRLQQERLVDRPQMRARLLEVMAEAYHGLGLENEATALLHSALALRPETGTRADTVIARTLKLLANSYQLRGRAGDALALNEQALRLQAELGADSVALAGTLGSISENLLALDQVDSALAVSNRAHDVLHRWTREGVPPDFFHALARARVLNAAGQRDSAEAALRSVVPALEALGQDAGAQGPSVYNNLAYYVRLREDYPEAERLYRIALDDYGSWMTPSQRIITLNNVASAMERQGDTLGAVEALHEGLVLARETWPQGSWRVGQAASRLVVVHLRTGRIAEAGPLAREAVESYREVLGPAHAWTANAESVLGRILTLLGQPREGEPLMLEAFDKLRANPGPDIQWTRDAAGRLRDYYESVGRAAEALRYAQLAAEGS